MEVAAIASDGERQGQGAVAEGSSFVGKEVLVRGGHDGKRLFKEGCGGNVIDGPLMNYWCSRQCWVAGLKTDQDAKERDEAVVGQLQMCCGLWW